MVIFTEILLICNYLESFLTFGPDTSPTPVSPYFLTPTLTVSLAKPMILLFECLRKSFKWFSQAQIKLTGGVFSFSTLLSLPVDNKKNFSRVETYDSLRWTLPDRLCLQDRCKIYRRPIIYWGLSHLWTITVIPLYSWHVSLVLPLHLLFRN